MVRRRWLLGFTLIVMAAALWYFWFFAFKPIQTHRRIYDRARSDIYSLASKRPPDVSRGQWEFVVGWTLNLHANCAAAHTWVDRNQMEAFADELERRLKTAVGMETIEWIWDEYAKFSKGGQSYSDKYRPTRSEDFKDAAVGCFGMRVD